MAEKTILDSYADRAAEADASKEETRPVALIVDQDDLARRVSCETVGAAGFDIAAAVCCDSAIAQISRGRVDLLLIADDLPEMSGHELAEIVAKDFPDLRCIFLLNPGAEIGPAASLRKPFAVEELRRTLASFEAEGVRTVPSRSQPIIRPANISPPDCGR